MTNNETSPSGNNLEEARIFLNSAEIDGWLTRDYRYTNPVFEAALGLHIENLTRPVWLWIPANGEPSILAHEVDIGRFPQGPIALVPYGSRNQMVEALKQILNDAKVKAEAEAEKIIESGSKKLENEANKTREELKQQLSSIVVETASKIIDEEIDEKKHENIIKKAAEEI